MDEEERLFRCSRCGSGYHNRIALSWAACPRCLGKDKTTSPLEFELDRRPPARFAGRRENSRARPTAVDQKKVVKAMSARQRLA